jgi:hypothetical protein
MSPSKAAPFLKNAVGPFPGTKKPVRTGLFLRKSPKTGQPVWSYYECGFGGDWYAYSDTKAGALDKYRRRKRSKHQRLDWYGTAKP